VTIQQIKQDIAELKEKATKKPNLWPRKRSKEEIEALLQKYRDAGYIIWILPELPDRLFSLFLVPL
jgi:hypothetical protein